MSGPKVVRIVTREEIEAMARRQLQLLEEALEELRRCAKRHGALEAGFEASLEQRRSRMTRLFQEEAWTSLQKQIPAEIAFLTSERDRIRAQAIAAAEGARTRRERMGGAARTLQAALAAAGRSPPAGLQEVAERVHSADEATLGRMQRALNEAFQQLVPTPQPGASASQRELAARLNAGEVGQRFDEWLAAQPQPTPNASSARLQKLLAEIEALEDAEVARPFLERAAAISRETQEGRRALLTDSLMLEVSAHVRARQAREATASSLREVRCGLSALDTPSALALGARISETLDGSHQEDLEGLLREARSTLEVEQRELAAAARRRAVLEGLTALGYEVRESMAVAWPKEGRIVVRKPGATDYGVEIGAPADAARVQIRLVGSDRPSAPRTTDRDRDMETAWCSEFQQLRKVIAEDGTDVEVERALEAGAQPVKTVRMASPESEQTATSTRTGHRTVR